MKCPHCDYQSDLESVRCPRCARVFDAAPLEELAHLDYLRRRVEAWRAEGLLTAEAATVALQAAEREARALETALEQRAPKGSAAERAAPAPTAEPGPVEPAALADDQRAPSGAEVEAPLAGHAAGGDFRLESLKLPERARVGELVQAAARIWARQAGPADLRVYWDNRLVLERRVKLQAGSQLVELPVRVQSVGAHGIRVDVVAPGAPPTRARTAAAAPAPAPATPAAEPAPPAPTEEPTAAQPAAPTSAGPAFSWRQVGTYLLSERTLHALLALGTFLVLASGVVISTINPTRLDPLPHLGAVMATTAIFYAVGAIVLLRLRLARTGETLLGIGGAFLPLNVSTLGQERLLNWDPGAVWLAASLLCLPAYLAFHALLRDRIFAMLAALAGGSELLALLNWLGVPLEWGFCTLVALASGYVALASRLRDGWPILARALFWAGQVATPVVMATLMLGKLLPGVWETASGRPPGGLFEYAVGGAWWLGVAFYALSARLFQARRYRFLAAWTLPIAYLFTLTKAPWGGALDHPWNNLAFALLALGYLLFGRLVLGVRALSSPRPSSSPRESLFNHPELEGEPVYQVALLLTLVAAFWPVATVESRAATLLTLSLTYGAAALLLGQRAWAYVSAYLLPFAYGFALQRLGFDRDTLPLAWAALAAALLAAAELAALRTGEARRPLVETALGLGAWRSRFASPLFSAGYAASLVALGLALGRYWSAPVLQGARDLHPLAILAFVSVVALYGASAATRRAGFFLYPATWLFLIPFTSAAALILARGGSPVQEHDLARLLAALGAGYLGVALATDRAGEQYARPIYLVGYVLSLATMLLSALDRPANVQVVGLSLLIYAGSAWLVHRGHHPSYLGVVRRLFGEPGSAAFRTARALFLYLASWLLPAWLLLAMSLWEPAPRVEHYGTVVALLAPLYVWLGLRFRRIDPDYRLPWYVAGYALSVAGPLMASPDPGRRVATLGISIALYLASAVVFRRGAWLYLVALLTPLLLIQELQLLGVNSRFYGLAMIDLALLYGLVGLALHPGRLAGREGKLQPAGAASDGSAKASPPGDEASPPGDEASPPANQADPDPAVQEAISPFALPFFAVGYLLAALGLGHVANQERWMVLFGFLLGALYYAGSALAFRHSLFAYPVAWTLAVAYVVGMLMTPLEPRYHGLGLLPGLAAYLAAAEILRRRLDRAGLRTEDWGLRTTSSSVLSPQSSASTPILAAWSAPFYTVLYIGTVALVYYSWDDRGTLALAWWGFAALYAASTLFFRHPGWLYPTVGGTVAAYLATLRLFSETPSFANAMLALAAAVWALLWLAHAVAALRPSLARPSPWPSLGAGRVWTHPWAAPMLVWGAGLLALSAVGSTMDAAAGFRTAAAYCLLLGALGSLWLGRVEAWAAVVFAAAGLQEWMLLTGIPFVEQPPRWAMAALAATLLAIAIGRASSCRDARSGIPPEGRTRFMAALALWHGPLCVGSIAVGAGALALALGSFALLATRQSLQLLAATTAVSGLTLVAHGFDRGQRLLVYLGVALLEAAYMLQLLFFDVGQPQAFVLPAGLYLLAVGYLEWRRGSPARVKRTLEMSALALLLGVSLLQAVGFLGAGLDRYAYDTFLFVESLALFGLGAALRWKRTFVGAILALVADVLILLSDPIRAMNTWYLVAMTGFLMIALVVFVEQRRQQIPLWIEEWQARLETWD